MSLIRNSGGRSWRLRCQIVAATRDWPCRRLLRSDGCGIEAEAPFHKWVWRSKWSSLFTGTRGMNNLSEKVFPFIFFFVYGEPEQLCRNSPPAISHSIVFFFLVISEVSPSSSQVLRV